MMTNLKAKINSSKMKVNYSLLMEQEIEKIKQSGTKPTLLLHSCCAPCSKPCIISFAKIFLHNYFVLFLQSKHLSPKKNIF